MVQWDIKVFYRISVRINCLRHVCLTVFVFLIHVFNCENLLVLKYQHVLLHQLSVSPPASCWCKIISINYIFTGKSKKINTKYLSISMFQWCLGFVCPVPFFSEAVNLVVVYISAGNIQYSAEEELVQLCAHSWTSARGNLRMAGAAKPRSPSRVEISNQPGVQKRYLLKMPWNAHLTFSLTP